MRGVYGHVSPTMRAELKAALQARWEGSLHERARLCPRSIVPTLDKLLQGWRQVSVGVGRRKQNPRRPLIPRGANRRHQVTGGSDARS
jgi:hypothetical protein